MRLVGAEHLTERESSIIERLHLSPESARAILSLRFPPEDEERMRDLMDKSNKGTIAEEEREEMETYRRLGNLLSVLQARARLHLRRK
jgi:hypothetical protein